MPFVLRTGKKRHWVTRRENPDDPLLAGLPDDMRPAEVYKDLAATDNELSVWFVEDDRSNLQDVVAAVASTKDTFDLVDYVLIDYSEILEICPVIELSPGKTPFARANTWHRDLRALSARQVADIACEANVQLGRVTRSEVKRLLVSAAKNGDLSASDLTDGLKESLFG